MATQRLRLRRLMAVGAWPLGACGSTPSAARGGGGADDVRGTGAARWREPPDPGRRGTASSTSRWSSSARTTTAAGARPTTRASSTSARTRPASHVAYIENVLEGADSEQVFRSLARKGFDFIIGTSFGYMDPMATVAEEFPTSTFLHLTGYKSNGKNFGNFFGAVEDFKYLAGMLAGLAREGRRQPEDRLHGDLPDPRGAPPRQRDHARRQGDLPRVHDGRPVHQHLARPGQGEGRRGRLALRRRRRSSSPAPTRRAVADVAQEKGKWAVTYDHPASCHGRRLPHRAVLDLGSRVRPDRASRSRPRPTRPATSTSTPTRRRWACYGFMDGQTPQQGRRRPARRRRPEGQGHASPRCSAGTFGRFDVFAGPIKDNTGKELLPAGRSSSRPTSTSSRPAPPATRARPACTGGTTGITSDLPDADAVSP